MQRLKQYIVYMTMALALTVALALLSLNFAKLLNIALFHYEPMQAHAST